MVNDKEKRCAARYVSGGWITLFFSPSSGYPMRARLLNYSATGLCFTCDHRLAPGTTVFVRASEENYRHPGANAKCQLRSMGLAVIKWCKEDDHQGLASHQMGATYLLHY